MATESSLWDFLKRGTEQVPRLHMTRIENGAGLDTPDVEGCYAGTQFWLELKVAARPVRQTTKLRFGSPLKSGQVEWGTKRAKAGGRAFHLIQVGAGADRALYLIPTPSLLNVWEASVNENECFLLSRLDRPRSTAIEVLDAICRRNR